MNEYDSRPLAELLSRLMQARGENQREASLKAGLDRGALYRFVEQGGRPSRDSAIALADHFKVDPNTLLELAGYPPLDVFTAAREGIPPELRGVVRHLLAIPDPVAKSRVIGALEEMLEALLEDSSGSDGSQDEQAGFTPKPPDRAASD